VVEEGRESSKTRGQGPEGFRVVEFVVRLKAETAETPAISDLRWAIAGLSIKSDGQWTVDPGFAKGGDYERGIGVSLLASFERHQRADAASLFEDRLFLGFNWAPRKLCRSFL